MTDVDETLRNGTDQHFPRPDADRPVGAKRLWSGKLGVWLLLGSLAVVFSIVSALVFTTPLSRNELGLLGGLHVSADEGIDVYVGSRHVGTGTVSVPWNELLGAAGRPALAIPINAEATDIQLPTLLGDNGAQTIWSADGPTGAFRGSQDANYSFRQVVLRRVDGQWDHVFLIDCEFPQAAGRWHRLLVPVRVRASGEAAATYYPQPLSEGGGNVSRGMMPSRRDYATFELKLSVEPGAPPSALASEVGEAGLWTPPRDAVLAPPHDE